MLVRLSRAFKAAAKIEFPHPPSATHDDMVQDHELRKANELRTRQIHERRFNHRW